MNFLADMEASIPAASDEPETEPTETPEEVPEPESQDPEPEPVEELEEDPEAEPEEPPTPSEPELADDVKFKVGEDILTGKELKLGNLRQADYTRKTQELAEERKQIEAVKEEIEEVKEWAQSLIDPEAMHFELQRYYPKAFAKLKEKIIQEAIEEQDLDPAHLHDRQLARALEVERKARMQDEAQTKKRNEKKELAQKTAELRVQYDKWVDETMKEAGLDPTDTEHQALVRDRIAVRHRDQNWDKDLFSQISAHVAKVLGKTPKAKPATPAKPAAKLPPSPRPAGNKTPAEAKEKAKATNKRAHKDVADSFTELRKKYGVR